MNTVSGIITLTTDFGHRSPFAAVMKGAILCRLASAKIVDLTHDIPPQWPPEAGFWVSRSYRWFPAGSVHVAVVDPGVGTERKILLAEIEGHCFMAPDNGLLATLLDSSANVCAWHLDDSSFSHLGIKTPSATFHGRDIFAPVAAEIAAGRVQPEQIGVATNDWVPAWLDAPQVSPGKIIGAIVTIDTFGNLISDIDADLLAAFKEPVVVFAGRQIEMQSTYGRARPGEYLALVNSFGVLEIARAEGNASDGLGCGRGAPVIIRDGYTA